MAAPDNRSALHGRAPTQTGAHTCLLELSRQPLGNICEPTKLLFKIRSSAFDLTPFKVAPGLELVPEYGTPAQNALDPDPCFSGARTGITFEGPFVKYTVASTAVDFHHPDKMSIRGTNNNAELVFFFDMVSNRPILLPYPGSVELFTQYPGSWEFEYYYAKAASADRRMGSLDDDEDDGQFPFDWIQQHGTRKVTPLSDDATLTLRTARTAAILSTDRTFKRVPPGCHSLTYNNETQGDVGIALPLLEIAEEETPVRIVGPFGPLSTLVFLRTNLQQTAFMSRVGVHNPPGGVRIHTDDASDGLAQFHLCFQ